MAPLPPEFEIKEPKGDTGQIFPGEEIQVTIIAEPGIEDYLNSLDVKIIAAGNDITPSTINFVYSEEFGEYTLLSKATPDSLTSGTGICKVGEIQTEFSFTV